MGNEIKRLVGVSLMSRDRVAVTAAYDGSVLLIGNVIPLTGSLLSWRKNAIEFVKKEIEAGAAVFVEEMADHVSQYAHQVLLQDNHPDENRPLISLALDNYMALDNAGALQFANGTQSIKILESTIDTITDDKGRNAYRVNWATIKGGHRALMLCCLATEGMQAVTENYVSELYSAIDQEAYSASNPLEKMAMALRQADAKRDARILGINNG